MIVIHGVIALGIKDSIKEVRNFFRRVSYQIGDMHFTPDDIEHGILRGNRRPPGALFRMFDQADPRARLSIEPLDPRIHFTLVCASSSCPPIEVYAPEDLERQLTLAGKTFVNAGGLRLDKGLAQVSLSRVFKWYGGDFATGTTELLRRLASFLYRAEDKDYIMQNAQRLRVDYQHYDWRLNRD